MKRALNPIFLVYMLIPIICFICLFNGVALLASRDDAAIVIIVSVIIALIAFFILRFLPHSYIFDNEGLEIRYFFSKKSKKLYWKSIDRIDVEHREIFFRRILPRRYLRVEHIADDGRVTYFTVTLTGRTVRYMTKFSQREIEGLSDIDKFLFLR